MNTLASPPRRRRLLVLPLLALAPLACAPSDSKEEASPATAPSRAVTEASAPKAPTPPPPAATARGAELYAQHCVLCHGAEGLGDGRMAKMLNPPPRGLVNEPWRYLDTSSPETLRTTMIELVRKGMPDKAMPGLAGRATDEEMAQIVDFVLSLRQ